MHRTWTNNDKFTFFKSVHEPSNSQTKSLHNIDKYIIPYPIKPSRNIIPKDLNLQKIFTTMIKSSQDLTNYYSFIFNDFSMDNILFLILLNIKYIIKRFFFLILFQLKMKIKNY